jgi:hypothetical protein
MYYIKSDFFCCFQTFKDLLGLITKPPFLSGRKSNTSYYYDQNFLQNFDQLYRLFLRTFRLFISGLQRYTLSTLLPNLFALYFNYFLSKNCPLFYLRVAKVRGR